MNDPAACNAFPAVFFNVIALQQKVFPAISPRPAPITPPSIVYIIIPDLPFIIMLLFSIG